MVGQIDNSKENVKLVEIGEIAFLAIIGILCILIGYNATLNNIIPLIIFAIILKDINKDRFYCYFVVIMLFENQLQLPFGIGTIMRPYLFLILIKFIADKNKITTSYLFITVPLVLCEAYLVFSGNYNFSIIINSLIIILIHSKTLSKKELLVKEFFYLGFVAIFFGLYGVVHNIFIYSDTMIGGTYSIFKRFSGAIYDPNYSSLIYNMGIISLLFLKQYINAMLRAVCLVSLFIFLLLTVSVQGITGSLLVISLFLLRKRKYKEVIKWMPLIIAILIVILNSSLINPYILRINEKLGSRGDYSNITSYRSEINRNYFEYFIENYSIGEKFFGGDVITGDITQKTKYVQIFGNVSHNSYIDMLFAVGFLGILIIVIGYIYTTIRCFKLYIKNREDVYLGIVYQKILVLYFGLGLSLFPLRYWIYLYLW